MNKNYSILYFFLIISYFNPNYAKTELSHNCSITKEKIDCDINHIYDNHGWTEAWSYVGKYFIENGLLDSSYKTNIDLDKNGMGDTCALIGGGYIRDLKTKSWLPNKYIIDIKRRYTEDLDNSFLSFILCILNNNINKLEELTLIPFTNSDIPISPSWINIYEENPIICYLADTKIIPSLKCSKVQYTKEILMGTMEIELFKSYINKRLIHFTTINEYSLKSIQWVEFNGDGILDFCYLSAPRVGYAKIKDDTVYDPPTNCIKDCFNHRTTLVDNGAKTYNPKKYEEFVSKYSKNEKSVFGKYRCLVFRNNPWEFNKFGQYSLVPFDEVVSKPILAGVSLEEAGDYSISASWADINFDGKDDICRIVGDNLSHKFCTYSNGSSFGKTEILNANKSRLD